jgi:hypothetical protein
MDVENASSGWIEWGCLLCLFAFWFGKLTGVDGVIVDSPLAKLDG